MKYGPETATVEAFIQHLKAMTPEQWAAARDAAGDAAGAAAWDAAWDAAGDAAGVAAGAAAWDAAWAVSEIQGAALMRERGQPFFFLPMFGFADPEAVVSAQKEPAK
jgi:hypothetical protein